jgi:hypothetical protein
MRPLSILPAATIFIHNATSIKLFPKNTDAIDLLSTQQLKDQHGKLPAFFRAAKAW